MSKSGTVDYLKSHFDEDVQLHKIYRYLDKFSTRLSFYDEQMSYKYNIRPDTTFSDTLLNPIQDTIVKNNIEDGFSNGNVSFYIKAVLFNHILFSGYSEYFLYGYKKENSKIDLKFSYFLFTQNELSLEGKYTNSRPDFFYENYTSNNFQWKNDYLRRIEEWDAGFAIRNSKYKLEAKIRYGQISNYIYLDTSAYVNQFRGQINMVTAELSKKFKLGPLNSVTKFVYQNSTKDSILNLSKYNLYQSLYFERLEYFRATGGKLLGAGGGGFMLFYCEKKNQPKLIEALKP